MHVTPKIGCWPGEWVRMHEAMAITLYETIVVHTVNPAQCMRLGEKGLLSWVLALRAFAVAERIIVLALKAPI